MANRVVVVPPRIRGFLVAQFSAKGFTMSSKDFASVDLTMGQMNAIVKKLGGHEAALKFLRGELTVSAPVREWREEDGVIYFDVVSNGMTGEEWITRLDPKGRGLSGYAKSVLRSKDFKPTSGITYRVAVLKGTLFSDRERITKNIRAVAKGRKFETPHAEVACLIRDKFSDEDIEAMGLWWVITMHDPIKDSDGDLDLLGAGRDDSYYSLYAYDGLDLLGAGRYGRSYSLNTYNGDGGTRWRGRSGFAFVLPQE